LWKKKGPITAWQGKIHSIFNMGLAYVLARHMRILRTPNSAIVSVYHTGKVYGKLISEKDVVQEAVVIVNPSEHGHSKFFPTCPAVQFQWFHCVHFVCMHFQTKLENCLHGCPGNLKLSTSTTDGFSRTALKYVTNSVDCQCLRKA